MAQEIDLAEAYRRCRARASSRLENFPVLSEFVAGRDAPHLAAVYAFCRMADDAADESPFPAEALVALDRLGIELDRAYGAQTPEIPEMRALQATIRERGLTRRFFEDLLDAFRQDQRKTRYANFEELLDYCRRSANPVGRLVLETIGERGGGEPESERVRLSDQLCTGLQLVNFWQDVAQDFDRGRIYLPQDALARHGVTEDDLAARRATPAFRALLRELCEVTEPCFREGAPLADAVAKRHRVPILAFAFAGLELLRRIREVEFDVFEHRPEIGKLPLARILAKAAAARWIPALRP